MDLQLNVAPPVLIPPDQSNSSTSSVSDEPQKPAVPVGAPGVPTPTTGGSTSGVDASKGASAAVGVNSLIVDPNIQNALSSSGISGIGMDAASVLGAAPDPINPQTMINSLGTVATDLDEISNVVNAFASDVSGLAGSVSPDGKIKGDSDHAKKAEGKGNGKAESSESTSPSAGSSVSRSVSPTGEVTTTITTESVNSTGGVTTNTTTTTSAGTSSQSTGSSTVTAPPPNSAFSFTTLMNEIGVLTNQESETMAQQQASEIDAINMQASDTMAQAADMLTGANMMMTMATVGLAVSMSATAYQVGGIGNASKEADQAELQGLRENQEALLKASDSSKASMDSAVENPGSVEATVNAQKEARQLRTLANDEKTPENIQKQANDLANNVEKASRNAALQDNGTKYADSDEYKQAQEDLAIAKSNKTEKDDFQIKTHNDATTFYQKQAKTAHTELNESISKYKSALSTKGLSPRKEITKEDAQKAVFEGWTKEEQTEYVKADDAGKSRLIDKHANDYKDSVNSIQINRNSSAWSQAYQNRSQQNQIFAGTIQAISQVFNSAGQMEDQTYQAYAQEEAAAAQVAGSTQQAMTQGVQQTQSLADQLRQEMNSIASDMQQAVGSTRV